MQRGDRKTLKLLTGTRFQSMAINAATKKKFARVAALILLLMENILNKLNSFPVTAQGLGLPLILMGV